MEIDWLIILAVIGIVVLTVLSSSKSEGKKVVQYYDTTPIELAKVRVRWVIDGDTVIVSNAGGEMRIRLDAIDCSESDQPWGDIAKAGLIKLIGGRDVLLEEHDLDRHGRTLATIYVWNEARSERINVNERMVMLGHAWVSRKYYNHLSTERRRQLDRLQRWARTKRVGLWKTDNPIPPWQWRNQGRFGL